MGTMNGTASNFGGLVAGLNSNAVIQKRYGKTDKKTRFKEETIEYNIETFYEHLASYGTRFDQNGICRGILTFMTEYKEGPYKPIESIWYPKTDDEHTNIWTYQHETLPIDKDKVDFHKDGWLAEFMFKNNKNYSSNPNDPSDEPCDHFHFNRDREEDINYMVQNGYKFAMRCFRYYVSSDTTKPWKLRWYDQMRFLDPSEIRINTNMPNIGCILYLIPDKNTDMIPEDYKVFMYPKWDRRKRMWIYNEEPIYVPQLTLYVSNMSEYPHFIEFVINEFLTRYCDPQTCDFNDIVERIFRTCGVELWHRNPEAPKYPRINRWEVSPYFLREGMWLEHIKTRLKYNYPEGEKEKYFKYLKELERKGIRREFPNG